MNSIPERMNSIPEWRTVYDFWFPPDLAEADAETHGQHFGRWFGGNANAELPPFAPLVPLAVRGGLDAWPAEPRGRLSLILVLDQFPRGLFAARPRPTSMIRSPWGWRTQDCGTGSTTR